MGQEIAIWLAFLAYIDDSRDAATPENRIGISTPQKRLILVI
jgi:hypothetical protein